MTSLRPPPFHEPLRTTLVRTGLIALGVGGLLAAAWGRLDRWPMAALLAFWFSFGGHWVEVGYLNFIRPRLSASRTTGIAARLAVWFAGGCFLAVGMRLTAAVLSDMRPPRGLAWWHGGAAFVGLELLVHALMRLRGLPNFYDDQG